MSSQLLSEFGLVVAAVFESWTALQLATANGPGGPRSREIVASMTDEITKLICENQNIDSLDVADVLHDMMDENFQTICEDNSPEEVGDTLCRYYSKWVSGEKHLVHSELESVKKLSSSVASRVQNRTANFKDVESVDANGEASVSVDSNLPVDDEHMETDSEWTTVKSRRRT